MSESALRHPRPRCPDTARRASWPLQDAGGDVIALCDCGGANGTARIITLLVYDAYGSVIGRDDPATPSTGTPELRVGHKGLFFDRLDGGIADPFTGGSTLDGGDTGVGPDGEVARVWKMLGCRGAPPR